MHDVHIELSISLKGYSARNLFNADRDIMYLPRSHTFIWHHSLNTCYQARTSHNTMDLHTVLLKYEIPNTNGTSTLCLHQYYHKITIAQHQFTCWHIIPLTFYQLTDSYGHCYHDILTSIELHFDNLSDFRHFTLPDDIVSPAVGPFSINYQVRITTSSHHYRH